MTAAHKRKSLHRQFVERLKLAGYQCSRVDMVQALKAAWLCSEFNVSTSKRLTDEQLDLALTRVKHVAISAPTDSAVRKMSIEQRKRCIRLGKYVLGEKYGGNWFWTKLPEWTLQYNSESGTPSANGRIRTVKRLDDLTMAEAVYVIRVMEQIEYRLAKEGGA